MASDAEERIVKIPCIRQPGRSRMGPGWHYHVFETHADLEAFKAQDRLRDLDDEARCPPEGKP